MKNVISAIAIIAATSIAATSAHATFSLSSPGTALVTSGGAASGAKIDQTTTVTKVCAWESAPSLTLSNMQTVTDTNGDYYVYTTNSAAAPNLVTVGFPTITIDTSATSPGESFSGVIAGTDGQMTFGAMGARPAGDSQIGTAIPVTLSASKTAIDFDGAYWNFGQTGVKDVADPTVSVEFTVTCND